MRSIEARAWALSTTASGRAKAGGRAEEVSLVRDLLREHLLQDGRRRGYQLPYEHVLTRDLGCSRNVSIQPIYGW